MNKTSNWWYLAPVFMGIVGGLLMFLVLRKEDNETAKTGLVIGIIAQVVGSVISIAYYITLVHKLAYF